MIKIDQFDKPINSFTVLTYLGLAIKHIWLWIDPYPGDMETILSLSTLIAFEFIMLHSGLFMMAFAGSKKVALFFFIFYGLFALAFNFAMPSNEILFLYLFVVFTRMRVIFYDKNKELIVEMFLYSAIRMGIYFVLIIPIALSGPFIPELGLTEQFLYDNHYKDFTNGMSGEFIEHPQVALCFGFIYFSALTIFESRRLWKKFNKKEIIN